MIFSLFQNILVFGYSWSTLLWYRCYYPHRSRDALSPVCGILKKNKVMFKPHLNMFIGAWGAPNIFFCFSWHNTEYCSVVSDFFISRPQHHIATISAGGHLLTINLGTSGDWPGENFDAHGGLHLRLRSFYKVNKKRIVIPLNKNHSAQPSRYATLPWPEEAST